MAKKEVELDFDAFISSIEKWDGANPPFDEVMRTAILHAALMHRGDPFIRLLGQKLEIAGSTVSRYATGVARPLGGVMQLVVREAHALLVAMRQQSIRDHNAMVLFLRHTGICSDDD